MSASNNFPDSSINNSTVAFNLSRDDIFTGANLNEALKGAVTTGVEFIPEVGGLLAGLLGALWPSFDQHPTQVWDEIEPKVRQVVKEMIEKYDAVEMGHRTEGLYKLMRKYLQTAIDHPKKGSNFDEVLSHFDFNQGWYLNGNAPWNNLVHFTSIGTLHLSLLRERYLFWDKMQGMLASDSEKYKTELDEEVFRWLEARDRIVEECASRHYRGITSEILQYDEDWSNMNARKVHDKVRDVHQNFQWSSASSGPKYEYDLRWEQWQWWSQSGYRAQIEMLLGPTFAWPLYSSLPRANIVSKNTQGYGTVVDDGIVDGRSGTVRRLMIDMPGWVGDGYNFYLSPGVPCYFTQKDLYEKHGSISKIKIWWGDRIDAIEVWYGGVSAGARGQVTGGQTVEMDISSECMITLFRAMTQSGDNSGAISDFMFGATYPSGADAGTIEAGKHTSTGKWEWSWDGHENGRVGDETKRLLYFKGYSGSSGSTGWIFRLLPVFGYYQTWGPLK